MLEEEIVRILSSAGIKTSKDKLEVPPQEEFGDIGFPCFELAKTEKKNPQLIAEETSRKIKPTGIISKVEARAGYVNFFFDHTKLAGIVLKDILTKKEKFGQSGTGKGKKIMVEFAQPNTHKGLHIGHFRNICLGESLCRVLEFSGHKVFRANYQGDIGPHVAKCLWGLINLHKSKIPKGNKGEWLGKVYAEASRKIGTDPDLEKEVDEINKKLYEGKDKKLVKLWKQTRQWSLDYFGEIYKELGTKFDKLYFESEVEKRGVEISKQALKKNIAKISEDAIIVDLEDYGLGIFILVTKEGTPLYSAKDLALAEKEFTDFKIDRCIHVVSTEQNLYFKQLFKTFELMNSPAANKSYHLAYEFVTLKEGKMASRMGNVVLYTQLRDRIVERVLKEMKGRKMKKREEIAKAVGIGAMKYGMLKISPEKTIFFDWEDALKLEGNTGPYLQYAHTRCSGILRKSKKWIQKYVTKELTNHEKTVVKILSRFPKIVEQAVNDLRSNYICNYVYDLAVVFNNFYESCPVIKAEKSLKNFRLTLVKATQIVLKNCLELIGIEAIEKM